MSPENALSEETSNNSEHLFDVVFFSTKEKRESAVAKGLENIDGSKDLRFPELSCVLGSVGKGKINSKESLLISAYKIKDRHIEKAIESFNSIEYGIYIIYNIQGSITEYHTLDLHYIGFTESKNGNDSAITYDIIFEVINSSGATLFTQHGVQHI